MSTDDIYLNDWIIKEIYEIFSRQSHDSICVLNHKIF